MPPPDKQELIHDLWDALAKLPASQSDEALTLLLATLGRLLDAGRGYWVGVCRPPDAPSNEPASGWRMGPVYSYRETPEGSERHWQTSRDMKPGHPGEWLLSNTRAAGRFRASVLSHSLPEPDFEPGVFRRSLSERGLRDALCVAIPVNGDSEVYVGFFREQCQADFSAADLELASFGLRSLAWFHRRVLLSHGLLLAQKPLTRMERQVLRNLLTDCSEKQIAEELKQKIDTTHKHVGSIYRKFGVNSRAGLMSVWLGHDPVQVLD